jgi:hypothetical protein
LHNDRGIVAAWQPSGRAGARPHGRRERAACGDSHPIRDALRRRVSCP